MSISAKILVAKGNLAVGGGDVDLGAGQLAEQFFSLVEKNAPDVVILELSADYKAEGHEKIALIRTRISVPIIVIVDATDHEFREYRFAGASECLRPPVNIWDLNVVIQHLLALARSPRPAPQSPYPNIEFGSIGFNPKANALVSDGRVVPLTTAEGRLLSLLSRQPLTTVSRTMIAEAIYSKHKPVSDRAIDIVVNRLRNKLVQAGGPECRGLIRTEFRLGYTFVAEPRAVYAPLALPKPSDPPDLSEVPVARSA